MSRSLSHPDSLPLSASSVSYDVPQKSLPKSCFSVFGKPLPARVSLSPLRMNLISGNRQGPSLMNEWLIKLNDITTGHK